MNIRTRIYISLSACILLIAGLFLVSCQKEGDALIPVISVQSPSEWSVFAVGDTIPLQASISDNKQLISVRITLIDSEKRPVLPSIDIASTTNPYSLNTGYPISDSLIESGIYEIQFQASDGLNISNSFVKVQVNALPRKFLYPVLITRPSSNQVLVSSLDTAGNLEEIYSRQGDYIGSAANSRNGLLYISGASKSALTAYNLREKKIEWSIPGHQIPEQHWFEGIVYQAPLLYVSYYEGYIKAFDKDGVTSFTSEKTGLYHPIVTCSFGEWIAASLREKETDRNALAIYYAPGGTLRQLFSPTPAIVALFKADNQHLLSFGNSDGNSYIHVFDKLNSTFTQLKQNPGDSIFCVSAMDANNYLLSGKDKVYWYSYNQNSLVVFASGLTRSRIACESTGMQVYAASDKFISIYSYPEGILLRKIPSYYPIADIQLLYNK
jgi:hypothetical protein